MKTNLQRIHWHSKQPIFSMDWDPLQENILLTGGGDNNIRLWKWIDGKPQYSGTLSKHIKSVNCVRFSPCGQWFASAGDAGLLVIWERVSLSLDVGGDEMTIGTITENQWGQEDEDDLEELYSATWKAKTTIRAGDLEDIYDISWSPCSMMLLIGLTNNSAQVWDIQSLKLIKTLKDHTHFIQGVAWDPLGTFLVTCSSDKTVKIWTLDARHAVCKLGRLSIAPNPSGRLCASGDDGRSLFNDEGVVSFFRRLSFSIDGSLLLVPGGLLMVKDPLSGEEECNNALYIWNRQQLNQALLCASLEDMGRQPPPSSALWGWDRAVLGIRFSPHFYEERLGTNGAQEDTMKGGLRMIYAIFSIDSVVIYDNRSKEPIASFKDLHYGTITDLSWSSDSRYLTISSTDGFLTSIEWENDELGKKIDSSSTKSYIDDLFLRQSNWYNEIMKIGKNAKKTCHTDISNINSEINNCILDTIDVDRDGYGDGDSDGETISINPQAIPTMTNNTPTTKRRIAPTLIN